MSRNLFRAVAALCACTSLAACAAERTAVPERPLGLANTAMPASASGARGPNVDWDTAAIPPAPVQEAVSALSGLYFYAGAGPSRFDNSISDDANFDGSVDESAVAYDLGVGYRLLEYVALEAGYIDPGEMRFEGVYSGEDATGTAEVDGYQLSAVGYYPIAEGLRVMARVGACAWESSSKLTTSPIKDGITTVVKDDDDGVDLIYGIGLWGDMSSHFGMRIEWRHMDSDEPVDAYLAHLIYSL